MIPKKYPQKHSGEEVSIDWANQDFLFACCDCCSVHRLRFRVDGDKLIMQAWRENHRTAGLRQHRGIPIAEIEHVGKIGGKNE
jgi:hypothetical protein